jgi:uncharacterized membrane protein YdfJ with MMPL/SSD domain
MVLVPAIMSLLGKSAWYMPSWLDRITPNLDIEGSEHLAKLAAAESERNVPERSIAEVVAAATADGLKRPGEITTKTGAGTRGDHRNP